jgi:hypothetical protein
MGDIYEYIAVSGGNYSTLQSCLDDNEQDLTVSGLIFHAVISGTWDNAEVITTSITLDGWETNVSGYVDIYTDSSARHNGNWDTSAYRLTTVTNWIDCIYVREPYTRIDGLQIDYNAPVEEASVIRLGTSAAGGLRVSNCILRASSPTTDPMKGIKLTEATFPLSIEIYNNIVYDIYNTGIIHDWGGVVSGVVYNNTFINCGIGISFNDTAGNNNVYLKNNLCINNGTDYVLSNMQETAANIASDTSSPDSLNNKTVRFRDYDNNDFRLLGIDTSAVDQGVTLESDPIFSFNTDITGFTRVSGTWDIGADESNDEVIWVSEGGTYTTLQAGETALQSARANLTAEKGWGIVAISGAWTSDDTSTPGIDGFITDSDHYIYITTIDEARHNGVWNNNIAHRIVPTSGVGTIINSESYVRIDGLQIEPYSYTGIEVQSDLGSSDFRISNCIIKNAPTYGILALNMQCNITIWNCLIYNCGDNGINLSDTDLEATISNVTCIDNADYGIYSVVGTLNITNCLATGNGTADILIYAAINYCATGDGSADDYSGDGNRVDQTFRFRDYDNEDYRLLGIDDGAKGYGTDLSAAPSGLALSTDFTGFTRSNWDIGCDECNDEVVWVSEGGANVTLSAGDSALVAARADLTAVKGLGVIAVSGVWSAADTATVSIDGGDYTVDDDHYIYITSVGVARHSGRWSDTAHRLSTTTVSPLKNLVDYTVIDGIQVTVTMPNDYQMGIGSNADYSIIRNCIVRGTGITGEYFDGINIYANPLTVKVYDNLIYDIIEATAEGIAVGVPANDCYLYNNTIANCTTGLAAPSALAIVKNNLIYNCTTPTTGTFNAASDYNATDGTSICNDNTNDRVNQTFSFRNVSGLWFDLDYHDEAARTYGTDLSSDSIRPFTSDIRGKTRSGSWDIGAFENQDNIVVIEEDGLGDYTTLKAAVEGAEAEDLTVREGCTVFLISGLWDNDETDYMSIDGWTTSTDYYIYVLTHPSFRHSGKWDETTHRLAVNSAGAVSCIRVYENNVRFNGIQAYMNMINAFYSALTFDYASGGEDHHLSNSILRMKVETPGGSRKVVVANDGATTKVWNNVFYDGVGSSAVGFYNGTGTTYLYNNTFQNCRTGLYSNTNDSVIAKNNIFIDCTYPASKSGDASAVLAAGTNYNTTDDSSLNYTVTGGGNDKDRLNQIFYFVDVDNHDFRLAEDDPGAKGHGVDLTNDPNISFSTDLAGFTRTAPWDIGALNYLLGFQYLAGGPRTYWQIIY